MGNRKKKKERASQYLGVRRNSERASQYLGLRRNHKKWQARIQINGKQVALGTYMHTKWMQHWNSTGMQSSSQRSMAEYEQPTSHHRCLCRCLP